MNACTQAVICFLTAKCKILKTVPKRPFVFHSEIEKLNFTETAIHSLTAKYKIFKVVTKGSFAFLQQIQKFKVASKLPFFFFFFDFEIQNLKSYANGHSFFLQIEL